MISFPNAKINLGLRITSRRPDGYHNLETVFYPIPLSDALEIVPATKEKEKFIQSGMDLGENTENNLVWKAYQLLKDDFDLPPIDIYLRKNIPVGAGLGGGSADAAFMLKLINEYASLKLKDEELEKYASRLGADCPFFIKNKPVFAEGIGDRFSEINLSLKGCFLLLAKPDIFISTKEAYSGIIPEQPDISIKEIIKAPIEQWKEKLSNDFEKNIFHCHPEIKQMKEQLYTHNAVYASMSGSGSSVFGIFKNKPDWKPNWKNCQIFILPLEI